MFLKFAYEGTIEKPKTCFTVNPNNMPTPAEIEAKEDGLREEFNDQCMKLVKLYILGENYDMEDVMNRAMDTLQDAYVLLCHKS